MGSCSGTEVVSQGDPITRPRGDGDVGRRFDVCVSEARPAKGHSNGSSIAVDQ